MKYPPDSQDFLSADGLSWGGNAFGPRKSALVGRRYVIFLLQEPLPSACAEPGISVENNSGAVVMATQLATTGLAARRTP